MNDDFIFGSQENLIILQTVYDRRTFSMEHKEESIYSAFQKSS